MDLTFETNVFKELLSTVRSVVVMLSNSANRDTIAAGLALYLSLVELQKSVTIAYPKPPLVGLSHLVGVNKLVQNLGNKNFVISLDYTEGSIEKVSYNIEGNKFNLVIEPRVGAPVFSEKNVSYKYSGINADLIITLGASTKELLGKYYSDNKQLFDEKPVVTFDHVASTTAGAYGKINVTRGASSISEVMTYFLKTAELPINSDIASNLYDGLLTGSRNFTASVVSADTFEAAAYLLRQGARKSNFIPRQEEMPQRENVSGKVPEAPQTPPDWLKPKIYKGSQLL